MKVNEQRKALAGAALAGITALVTAATNGGGISQIEWLLAAAAVIGTYASVYGVKNAGFVYVGTKPRRRRRKAVGLVR